MKIMNKRGEGESSLGKIILIMVLVAVILFAVISKIYGGLNPITKINYASKNAACKLEKELGESFLTNEDGTDNDVDDDEMPDNCDVCVYDGKINLLYNGETKEVTSANDGDDDRDGLPDLCDGNDKDHQNPSLAKCAEVRTTSDGKTLTLDKDEYDKQKICVYT